MIGLQILLALIGTALLVACGSAGDEGRPGWPYGLAALSCLHAILLAEICIRLKPGRKDR